MPTWLVILAATPVALLILALGVGQLGLLRGKAPTYLGLKDGKLAAPSRNPNSVSSQATLWPNHPQSRNAHIAPLPLVGDGTATMARIQAIVLALPGTAVVKAEEGYLYATFSSRLMKFSDDVEFWLDAPHGVVQVRSASRLGRNDLGVNRARIEAIRAQLTPR